MPSIVLVRHGQASFGADNYDQLSELGKKQSSATGVQLLQSGLRPTHVYSGDLQRQRHTAQIALEAMDHSADVRTRSAFNEYDSFAVFTAFLPIVLENHPDMQKRFSKGDYSFLRDRNVFRKLFFPVMLKWIQGVSVGNSDHEVWADFHERVTGGLHDIRAELSGDDCAVVFTSGGVISTSLVHALGIPRERGPEFDWRTANASITRFICTDRGLELEGYNNYTHLQSGEDGLKVTYL